MNRSYQIILLIVLTLLFNACVGTLSPQYKQNNLLPIVKDIKYISDINKVAFEWQPIYSPNVQGYRIYKTEEKRQKELSSTRKSQIGSGDRSEKIRTYNFPQNRVTDHRINFTSHNLDRILDGELEELISKLKDYYRHAD